MARSVDMAKQSPEYAIVLAEMNRRDVEQFEIPFPSKEEAVKARFGWYNYGRALDRAFARGELQHAPARDIFTRYEFLIRDNPPTLIIRLRYSAERVNRLLALLDAQAKPAEINLETSREITDPAEIRRILGLPSEDPSSPQAAVIRTEEPQERFENTLSNLGYGSRRAGAEGNEPGGK